MSDTTKTDLLESGKRVPSVEAVQKLAAVLGCSAASIHAEAERT